jgi:hypothetical protein
MEFLATLNVETVGKETKIHFRFFNEFFEMPIRGISNALGFDKKCTLEATVVTEEHDYERSAWWSEISNEPVSSKNSIISIHNPTQRVLAKYLAMVVFSEQTSGFAAPRSSCACLLWQRRFATHPSWA